MFPHLHFHFHWRDVWPFAKEIIALAMALISAGVAAYRRWASFSWPEIHGTVEHYVTVGDSQNARCGIAYAYSADGEYYAGSLAVARRREFPKTEDDVRRLYPKGSRVRVRYKPGDPSVSVGIPAEVPPKSVYFPPRDDPR
jgi:hypothetical protein